MNAKMNQVSPEDVRALLDLMVEVSERRSDARQWRRHALEGLCRLLEAQVALTANIRNHHVSGQARLDLLVDTGWSNGTHRRAFVGHLRKRPLADPLAASIVNHESWAPGHSVAIAREEAVPDHVWYSCPDMQRIYKGADVNHGLCWMYCGPEHGMSIGVRVFRPWGETKRFTDREVALLELAGSQLSKLYLAEMREQATGPKLPPRARQTLSLLKSGKSEREIAEILDISPHTVHDYIKGIYKHYKVASSRELLANFID